MNKALCAALAASLMAFASCGGEKGPVAVKNDPALNGKLAEAVKASNAKAVERLLGKGADPNAFIAGGRNSAFHLALFMNDAAVIRLLADAGADLSKADQNNIFPLALAAQRNNAEIVGLLIDKGADVNAVNKNPVLSTALMDAAEANALDALRVLVDRGADIDMLDKYNAPAVVFAADKNHLEAVKLLAEAGAELNVVDTGLGYAALDFAIRNKNDGMIAYLESKGAVANKLKK